MGAAHSVEDGGPGLQHHEHHLPHLHQHHLPHLHHPHGNKGDDSHEANPFNLAYKRGKLLGKGGFSEVWECKDRASGAHYACKAVEKSSLQTEDDKARLASEVQVMQKLEGQDPGLVQLREVVETDKQFCLVMDLCQGGNLYSLVKEHGHLPEPAVRLVLRQLASALQCMHSQGVVHRDIKIRNILFNRKADNLYAMVRRDSPVAAVQAKIADFGLSVIMPEPSGKITGCVGTLRFTAPEVLLGHPYGTQVDMWGLGVVLCVMLTGKNPFAGLGCQDEADIRTAIEAARVDFGLPCWKKVSQGAKILVHQMMEVDPSKRLTAADLVNHHWLMEGPGEHADHQAGCHRRSRSEGEMSRGAVVDEVYNRLSL